MMLVKAPGDLNVLSTEKEKLTGFQKFRLVNRKIVEKLQNIFVALNVSARK